MYGTWVPWRYTQCVCAYGTSEPWVYSTLRSSDSIGALGSSDSMGTWRGKTIDDDVFYNGTCVFVNRIVLWLVLESYGTLVAVSAPLVMPLPDSDIPMNVPLRFVINKQTITHIAASNSLGRFAEHAASTRNLADALVSLTETRRNGGPLCQMMVCRVLEGLGMDVIDLRSQMDELGL
jgi:hypothetical protein